MPGKSWYQRKVLMAILWPSFLVACAGTAILFAFIDPRVLMSEVGIDSISRLVGYSLAFLLAWLAGIVTAFFAIYILGTPAPRVRQEPSSYREVE